MAKKLPLKVNSVCKWFGISKSGFYKKKQNLAKVEAFENLVCQRIRGLRKLGLMCGARKIKKHLQEEFDIKIGRDRLLDIMRKNDLQCQFYKVKVKHSSGVSQTFPNLLMKDFKKTVNKFGQAIVTDITYIKLPRDKFCYISLVTDLATRKILGYNAATTLLAKESVKVMKKTIKRFNLPDNCIHHSDKGVQYTSKEYTDFLKKNNFRISMTGDGKCYDNACAERIFNTLKNEFGFHATFSSVREVREQLKIFVDVYNNKRYHIALNYKTPEAVYLELKNVV